MTHIFESARLEHRQLDAQDWDFFYSLYSNPKVMGFISDIACETAIREQFNSRISDWNINSNEWLSILILSKASRLPLGITGFKLDKSDSAAELGYLFSEEAWGHGYASESLSALLDYAQNNLGIVKYKATVTGGNVASEKLLLKKGFVKDKTISNAIFLDGKWHDDLIYKLLV